MKQVVIKSIPVRHFSYFQWLLLGLHELEKKGTINLKFRLPVYQFVYFFILNDYLRKQCFRLISRYHLLQSERYALTGIVKDNKPGVKKFAFDIADSPFVFDSSYLRSCDIYFKVQCPKTIDPSGFRLSDEVFIPYPAEALMYKEKIRPAMLGPRRLSWSLKYDVLKKAYDNYLVHQTAKKDKFLMCYFGNAKGPVVKPLEIAPDSFDGEDLVMGFYHNKLQHPNEKRYQLYRIIKQMGDQCDARIINKDGVIDDPFFLGKDEVVPLKDFTGYISNFKYNANISGFRMSIPNRFIESFMVGTAIVTDQLAVKWYRDFEEEVAELPEMGYLPERKVNWSIVQEKLNSIKDPNPLKVIEQYNNNWSPIALAQYIVTELS